MVHSEKDREKEITEGLTSPTGAIITRVKIEPGKSQGVESNDLKKSSLKGCNRDYYHSRE